jgi:hypothetical protein
LNSLSLIKKNYWITKMYVLYYTKGHKVKNWKRRWFVLHADSLSYYKAPNHTKPLGVIKIDKILSVQNVFLLILILSLSLSLIRSLTLTLTLTHSLSLSLSLSYSLTHSSSLSLSTSTFDFYFDI